MLRYVADSINVDLTFKRSDNQNSNDQQSENSDLIGYSDSDFVELKDKRHSIENYLFMLVDETITHSSKQQLIIVLSSCEIEYMILFEVDKEAI
jgi:hypothetical protein